MFRKSSLLLFALAVGTVLAYQTIKRTSVPRLALPAPTPSVLPTPNLLATPQALSVATTSATPPPLSFCHWPENPNWRGGCLPLQ